MFNKTQRKWEEQEITQRCATLWKKKSLFSYLSEEAGAWGAALILCTPASRVYSLQADSRGALARCMEVAWGLGFCPFYFFFFVSFVLTEDLIPPGTCLTRITRISGMNDLSRWLCEGSVPIPGQAEILALSAVALAAFNVCSSPYKYCLGSKFGQLWDYCTICNPYALLNLWLARWLRGSFSTPAVSPPCPCALGGTIQRHWLDSSWQGEQ